MGALCFDCSKAFDVLFHVTLASQLGWPNMVSNKLDELLGWWSGSEVHGWSLYPKWELATSGEPQQGPSCLRSVEWIGFDHLALNSKLLNFSISDSGGNREHSHPLCNQHQVEEHKSTQWGAGLLSEEVSVWDGTLINAKVHAWEEEALTRHQWGWGAALGMSTKSRQVELSSLLQPHCEQKVDRSSWLPPYPG